MNSYGSHSTGTETAEAVWDSIAAWIRESNFKAGDQLPGFRELAVRLGVKPTVVRDALLHAQAKGAVRIVPRVGAFVHGSAGATISPASASAIESHNLLHLLDARRLVEVELIGRAAERRRVEDLLPARRALEALLQLAPEAPRAEFVVVDVRFHQELAQLAGNPVLANMLRWLLETIRPQLIAALADVPTNAQMRLRSDQYHASIYSAVAEGDAAKARREMHEHLSVAYDYLLRLLQSPPTASPAR